MIILRFLLIKSMHIRVWIRKHLWTIISAIIFEIAIWLIFAAVIIIESDECNLWTLSDCFRFYTLLSLFVIIVISIHGLIIFLSCTVLFYCIVIRDCLEDVNINV